jgi:hypothetical protein
VRSFFALAVEELNRKLLPEPDQIAGDPRFVDIGRQRARNLAEPIRHQN